jgi:hypothetical protein
MLISLGAITTIESRRTRQILMVEESTTYHAKNMDHTYVQFAT